MIFWRVTNSSSEFADRLYVPGKSNRVYVFPLYLKEPSFFSTVFPGQFPNEIYEIDILDCNAGDHGYPFATNFNPEINLREVSAKGRYWERGEWKETESMEIMFK